MIIAMHEMAELINVDNILDIDREVDGFGHTGKR
jgi:dUTPase